MLVPLGVRQGFGASFQLVQGAEDAAGTDRLAPSGGGWEVTRGPCRTQEPGQAAGVADEAGDEQA